MEVTRDEIKKDLLEMMGKMSDEKLDEICRFARSLIDDRDPSPSDGQDLACHPIAWKDPQESPQS